MDSTNILGTGPMDVQSFYNPGTFVWEKPHNCKWIYILAAGGGGAGGSGSTKTTTSGGGGGGGGGAGGCGSIFIPSFLLQDTLYLTIGRGGVGGTGASGTLIHNYFTFATSHEHIFYVSYGTAGGNGTSTSGGARGSNGDITYSFSHFDILNIFGPANGTDGGYTNGYAADVLAFAAITTGGSGGGRGNAAGYFGGTVWGMSNLYPQNFPVLYGGTFLSSSSLPASPPTRPINGLIKFYGGVGGGGKANQSGQSGTNGGPGCGGGGGSGSKTGSKPGSGGNGGDGFVIIAAG